MLELMASYMPYVAAPVIIFEAQSFNWIYKFLLKQYGYSRSDEALTFRFAQTQPKEVGRKTRIDHRDPPISHKPQRDPLNRYEKEDSATRHHDQVCTAGVILPSRQPIQKVPYDRFNTKPKEDLAEKAKDDPTEKVIEKHSGEDEMRVTNGGREAATGKESENGDREVHFNTPDMAQTARR